MEAFELEAIIGRSSTPIDNSKDLLYLKDKSILITGAKGSLGNEVVKIFLATFCTCLHNRRLCFFG